MGHFSPTWGQGTVGKATPPRKQNWEWSILYSAFGEREAEAHCNTSSSYQFERMVSDMRSREEKREWTFQNSPQKHGQIFCPTRMVASPHDGGGLSLQVGDCLPCAFPFSQPPLLNGLRGKVA